MNEGNMSTAIKGAIGEFYVASFLSALNLVVALPRGGVPSSDLLVTTSEGKKTISLQVKTALSRNFTKSKKYEDYYSWPVSEQAKDSHGESHWYAFVNMNNWPGPVNAEQPDIYFVDSETVAHVVKDWNDKPSPRIFFRIKDVEKEHYKGLAGFEKMKEVLTRR
jgi:hypothetical protein